MAVTWLMLKMWLDFSILAFGARARKHKLYFKDLAFGHLEQKTLQ
jgi:hypothetical protein